MQVLLFVAQFLQCPHFTIRRHDALPPLLDLDGQRRLMCGDRNQLGAQDRVEPAGADCSTSMLTCPVAVRPCCNRFN